MRRSRLALVASLLALSWGVGGCSGDDPKPKIAPPESSAPVSASESPTAEPAVQSPEEVVRAWVEAQNEAMRTGDSSQVRALSANSCRSCEGLIDPIDAVYAAGGFFKTTGWTISAMKEARSSDTRAKVNAGVIMARGRTVNAKGEEPVVYGVERSILVFKLSHADSGWLVSFIGFLS